jgi:hypothetical protein
VQRPSAVVFNGLHRLREAAAATVELPRHPCAYERADRPPKSNTEYKKGNQGRRRPRPEGREVGEGRNRTLEEGEVTRGRRAEELQLRRPVSCRERRSRLSELVLGFWAAEGVGWGRRSAYRRGIRG